MPMGQGTQHERGNEHAQRTRRYAMRPLRQRTRHASRTQCMPRTRRMAHAALAFALAFSLVASGGLFTALAAAWATSGTTTPFVENITVYQQIDGVVQKDVLANALPGDSQTVSIEKRAGTIQLATSLLWNNNGKSEEESGAGRVTWQSTDTKVAAVSPEGLVTAAGDGSCDITCSIAADQGITDGADLKATVHLNVSGQSGAVRVSAIQIWCDGERIEGSGNPIIKTVEESQLATETLALYAIVDVLDPATDTTKSYSTKDGLLSKQVEGLADIVWSVENSDYAAIDSVNGSYRQNNFGASVVYATWGEGTDYQVRQQATITYRDANPSENTDGFSPQSTLRIKAYYEVSTTGEKFDKPPSDDSGQFVVDKTLSLAQVKGVDSTTATYSSVDSTSGSYMTITGTGAYLSKLIDEAGVKIDGIDGFWFQTADSGGGVYAEGVSYDFLYGTERYYYPRAKDGGKERYADKVQVWPIVAWETSQLHRNDGNCAPDYDMNNGRSFCLLMGGTTQGGNSNKWARNIKTIYVKLSGKAPASTDGDGQDDGGDKKDDGDGGDKKQDDQQPDDTDNQGDKDGGNGDDKGGSGNIGDDNKGGRDNGGIAAGTNDSDGGSGTSADDGTNGGAEAGAKSGASRMPRAIANAQSDVNQSKVESTPTAAASKKYYVYQGMNNNEVEDANELDYDNPLAPYVLPAALVVFLIGALQAVWWYVRQQRETKALVKPRSPARASTG